MSTQMVKELLGFPAMSDQDLVSMVAARSSRQRVLPGCSVSGAGCGGYYG